MDRVMDTATALSVRGLRKDFGGLRAVDELTFVVKRNGVTSVIGPNGAGKTTLFNCITGMYRPTHGKVYLGEKDITGWPAHRVARAGLIRTFQITTVFPGLSVRDNLRVALKSANGHNFRLRRAGTDVEERVEQILVRVGVEELGDQLAREIGHGDRRSLEIGLALALNPVVVLLDEPTAGMSLQESRRMSELVRTLGDGMVVLLVEHDMEVVLSISDRIIVMATGKTLADGTPDEITENPAVKAAYLGK